MGTVIPLTTPNGQACISCESKIRNLLWVGIDSDGSLHVRYHCVKCETSASFKIGIDQITNSIKIAREADAIDDWEVEDDE